MNEHYHSLVGILMYLPEIRPGKAYRLHLFACHDQKNGRERMQFPRHALCFDRSTKDKAVTLKGVRQKHTSL